MRRLFTRRFALLALLTVVLAGLATVGTWAVADAAGWSPAPRPGTARYGPATGDGDDGPGGYGPGGYGPGGMMGGFGPGGYGPGGMMGGGYWLSGDGRRVGSMEAARQRAQQFADRLGLRAGEVMQFSNGFYVELNTPGGSGATEVLVDPSNGAVGVEYGPAMMWNTRYGMHGGGGDAPVKVSAERAVTLAQRWLDDQRPGMSAAEPEPFPGYYTLHTLRDGKIVGMLSVNATTGAVWYHTWHGAYQAMSDE